MREWPTPVTAFQTLVGQEEIGPEGTVWASGRSEFSCQKPRDGKRKRTVARCSLTSRHVPWHELAPTYTL